MLNTTGKKRNERGWLTSHFKDVCQPALSIQIIWTNLALNATTDLNLMSIPVPMLWKSGLKLSRKIASTILLTSGVFIVVCALLRSILITIVSGPFVFCHSFNFGAPALSHACHCGCYD